MKSTSALVTGLCALGAFSLLSAQALNVPSVAAPAAGAPKAAAPTAGAPIATAPAATFTETQVLETIGWYLGKQGQIDTFLLTPAQIEIVQRGFAIAAADREAPVDLEKIGPQLQAFATSRNEMYIAKLKKKGQDETEALFAKLRGSPSVSILPSGLAFEILKPGTGANAKTTDTVVAHYTATFANGTVFDTSKQPASAGGTATPVDMAVATSLPGLVEGLQKINKGGRIKLYLPAKLAFGEDGVSLPDGSSIPPMTALIFDIEVSDIKPTPGPASLSPMVAPGAPLPK